VRFVELATNGQHLFVALPTLVILAEVAVREANLTERISNVGVNRAKQTAVHRQSLLIRFDRLLVLPPPGKDPAEIVQAEGKVHVVALVQPATNGEYLLEALLTAAELKQIGVSHAHRTQSLRHLRMDLPKNLAPHGQGLVEEVEGLLVSAQRLISGANVVQSRGDFCMFLAVQLAAQVQSLLITFQTFLVLPELAVGRPHSVEQQGHEDIPFPVFAAVEFEGLLETLQGFCKLRQVLVGKRDAYQTLHNLPTASAKQFLADGQCLAVRCQRRGMILPGGVRGPHAEQSVGGMGVLWLSMFLPV